MLWFEVDKEEARKWVLLAEKLANTTNFIRASKGEQSVVFFLPDMFPDAWTTAIFACSSKIIPAENGWMLEIQQEAHGLLLNLQRSANVQLI